MIVARRFEWLDVVGVLILLGSMAAAAVGGGMEAVSVCVVLVAVAAIAVRRVLVALRRNEHAAATSHREFVQLFAASPVPQSITRLADGVVIAVNPAYQRTFGVEERDIVGRRPSQAGITIPELSADVWIRSPAGEHEVLMSSGRGTVDGVAVEIRTFVDVTERNRAQRGAREVEGRLRELVENISEVTWLMDPANTVMHYVSPAYEKVFGRPTAGLYADARDWLHAVHPDDRARMAAWRHGDNGDGEGTFRIVRPDGTERTIEFRMFPVSGPAGSIVRYAGVAIDVTERRLLEEQLRQTQKLESIGLLAGGVAHDFNNVLAVISGNLGLLAESLSVSNEDHELVEEIDAAVKRATWLTRQLLAFSRKQPVQPIVINLNDAVKDMRKMLRRMVGEDVVITTSLDSDLAAIKIDPGHFVQVLMNLAVNARDAMPRGGSFSLTTRNVSASNEVILEVSDTGTGMTPQVRARVFEPFFTTKDCGRGTGLGLSVVHGIIEQAGGRIELESVLGTGTTFRFVFPACDQPTEVTTDRKRRAPVGNETILVVDDDAFVRSTAARSLRARGYTVVEARDGVDAMARLREHSGVSLLLTDVIMPGLDGGELARMARAECPGIKVLFISGHTDDALADHGVRPSHGAFLEKPFGTYALAGKVREVIDGGSPVREAAE